MYVQIWYTIFVLNCTASGDGEKIMQFCPSFHIVQLMREGIEPQKACEIVVKMMADRAQKWFEVAVIALNTKVSIWLWMMLWLWVVCSVHNMHMYLQFFVCT